MMRTRALASLLAGPIGLTLNLGSAIIACGGGTSDAPSMTPSSPTSGGENTARTSTLDGRLSVPVGLAATYFAKGLAGIRFMAVSPEGVVYASQPGSGRVVRLPDANGDGVADSVIVAVSGLAQPHGLAFHKGVLYVAATDGVVRVALGADGRATGSPVYVNGYSGGGGHWTRTIVFGADSAMYVAVGSSCNLCVEQSSDRAAVLRFNEDGSGKRVYASGLRNAVGLAVEPTTRALWASQNERDNLPPDHENLPPEEINILSDGGDYGWPYCYGDRVPNPEYGDTARCGRTIPPAAKLQAHSAPLGMSFLARATLLPADYRGDLLVAYHGSWNRDTPTGAKVVRVRVTGGAPGVVEDFITGWQGANGSRWGRPVDVVVAADGAVFVSDDQGGAIYRIAQSAP
jgi:glucose/arabinose dehydrogenase